MLSAHKRSLSVLPLIFLLSAATASAVTFELTGITSSRGRDISDLDAVTITANELVTLDIRVRLDPGDDDIVGLQASVYGYESGFEIQSLPGGELDVFPLGPAFEFVSGEAVHGTFNDLCLSAIGCFGDPIPNAVGGSLVEENGTDGSRVRILDMSTTSPLQGDSGPGLDGIPNGGDAHFRVTLRNLGYDPIFDGRAYITIGTGYPGDFVTRSGGLQDDANNLVVALRYVPEPGTALLLGLGLCLLSRAKGRS